MPPRGEQSAPTQSVVKRLFAKSGNRCTFPGCPQEIVQGETIIGQVCHIKAQSPSGPRYDPQQTAAERHDFPNLILLCANHHLLIDGDPDTYTVAALTEIKAAHEQRSAAITEVETERVSKLLVRAEEGSAAPIPARPEAATTATTADIRRIVLAATKTFHAERTPLVAANNGAVKHLGGALLVLHVYPLAAIDHTLADNFDRLSGNPDLFPPMPDRRPRDHLIDFDGLLTGSNAEGIKKDQRAHVRLFRSGVVESVVSSVDRGRADDLLSVPHLQAMLIKHSFLYTRALASAEIPPPYGVACSLVNVNNMRLLHDFIPTNALAEDMPQGRLNQNRYDFVEAVIETVPENTGQCAKQIKGLLNHIANAAGLATSPYFDAAGNYQLDP